MKAIVYEGANQLQVREVPMPQIPEGWGLVRVRYAGICGTDLNIYAGTHPRAKAPLVMGHEFSGVMAESAPGFPKGTRVTVSPLLSCGECTPCREGNGHVCNDLKLIGIDRDGAMADYTVVPLERIVALPDGISDQMGAAVEPVAVGVHTIRECGCRPGDNALIFGGGAIGLIHALVLCHAGASCVVIAEPDPSRAQLGRKLGFEVIGSSEEELERIVNKATGGNGFDWVFDCAGVQPVADKLLDMVKVKGCIVIVASYKKPASMPFIKGMFKEARFQFVRVYRQKDFEIAALLAGEDPAFEKIITHVLPADRAQEGFDLLTRPGSGAVKVIFEF